MSKTMEQFNEKIEDMELKSMDKAKIKSYAKDLYKSAYTLGAESETKEDKKAEDKKADNNKKKEKSDKDIVSLARSKRLI